MGKVFSGWNPAMNAQAMVSGAASGSTFALAGITTKDQVVSAIVFDGNTRGLKAVLALDGTDFVVTADGVAKTILTATNADTLLVTYVDVSAGSEA